MNIPRATIEHQPPTSASETASLPPHFVDFSGVGPAMIMPAQGFKVVRVTVDSEPRIALILARAGVEGEAGIGLSATFDVAEARATADGLRQLANQLERAAKIATIKALAEAGIK